MGSPAPVHFGSFITEQCTHYTKNDSLNFTVVVLFVAGLRIFFHFCSVNARLLLLKTNMTGISSNYMYWLNSKWKMYEAEYT